jgi:hypothetical protein
LTGSDSEIDLIDHGHGMIMCGKERPRGWTDRTDVMLVPSNGTVNSDNNDVLTMGKKAKPIAQQGAGCTELGASVLVLHGWIFAIRFAIRPAKHGKAKQTRRW